MGQRTPPESLEIIQICEELWIDQVVSCVVIQRKLVRLEK